MKLSNLSLAIFVALGVAACGGSNNDNQAQDRPQQNPQNPSTPAPNNSNADSSALPKVVDPTQTQVVDNKDLGKVESVGTLQYIRREGSNYDRSFNPSQPASASPYLGVHLDDQNPKLTNIVLARQNLVKTNGQPVKAQFTGSTNREPLNADGTVAATQVSTAGNESVQIRNYQNVDVLAGAFAGINTDASHTANTEIKSGKFVGRTRTATDAAPQILNKTTGKYETLAAGDFGTGAKFRGLTANEDLTAVSAVRTAVSPDKATGKDYVNAAVYKKSSAYAPAAGSTPEKAAVGVITPTDLTNLETANIGTRRYGGNLVWWSSPNDAFENDVTRAGGTPAANSADATTGLVRIGGGLETLGQELNWDNGESKWTDHHNTATRIFGRYHLAYAKDGKVNPVTLNTFVGAASFIAEVNTSGLTDTSKASAADIIQAGFNKAKTYSIGAVPGHLENVQYGRVTTNLDLDLDADTYGDGFMHSPYAVKNDDGSVDNYFYRGTNATTVAEMAALPTDKKLVYSGHALMYGIDNSYHGQGANNLPNAFNYGGSEGQLGLGNFVEATADLATKKLTGTVYNAWLLDQSKAAITKDVLVNFSGDIVGNSAWGSADRAYIAGDDKADFRASFFGDKAEELGGSFNTVQSIPANGNEAYGSAYGAGDWGGVFGAKQAGSGNTFQGDDGANVYTGLSN